jgi:hypothetical protein
MLSAENLAEAKAKQANFEQEFQAAVANWSNLVQSGGNSAQGQTAAEDVLRRWRAHNEMLRDRAQASSQGEGTSLDMLYTLIGELEEQKAIMAELQSRAGSSVEQASSVNPKTRSSPYTNLLGLDRVFRPSTRMNIIIATIVFAVLALGILGWIVYRMITVPAAERTSFVAAPVQGGGGGRR